jgi:hypothetical protein
MMSSTKNSSQIADDCEKMAGDNDIEKSTQTNIEEADTDLDHVGELEGYVLDAQAGNASLRHLKTTKDGTTILIPQPSSDPNDPLNWNQAKKNVILAVIAFTGLYLLSYILKRTMWLRFFLSAFLPDYGSATGAVTLIPQAT